MRVVDYLTEKRCRFRITEHRPVYTASQLAVVEEIPARMVAKPVIVRADGKFYMCVLPADRKIDFYALQKNLQARHVELAAEADLEKLFPDSELGAEPPLGYELPVLLDKALAKDKEIVFQGGSHDQSVWMSMKDYRKLVNPMIFSFSYAAALDEVESMPFDPFFYDPYGM